MPYENMSPRPVALLALRAGDEEFFGWTLVMVQDHRCSASSANEGSYTAKPDRFIGRRIPVECDR